MKKNLSWLFLFVLCASPLHAAFTVDLDAGELTSPGAAPMQHDNTSGSPLGSLLLLVDLGSSNTVSNTLTPGNYVSGTNFVLAAGGFNTEGGTNETLTAFTVSTAATTGDEIALRWFPQITLTQYNSSAVTVANEYFGTYNPSGANPDGGNTWTVPSSGLIDLNFFTTNSDLGGTQPPSAGFAGVQVTPEPSTFALLLGLGLPLMFWARRRAR